MKIPIPVLLSSVAASIFIFTILSFFIVWIGFPTEKPQDSFKDALGFSSGIFAGSTTFGSAIIAAYLFNNWRDEKNHDIKNNLLSTILTNIKPIYIELHKIKSNSDNIRKIDDFFIVKTEYLKRNRLDMYTSVINLFPEIKIFCDIKNDNKLLNLYNSFDKHCFVLDDIYKQLFLERYKDYYEKVLRDNPDMGRSNPDISYDIFEPYRNPQREESLRIQIFRIKQVFLNNSVAAIIDNEQTFTNFDNWIDETIRLCKEIQDYSASNLKA